MNETKSHAGKRRATREFWAKHITGWKESGLTQARYCEENGLNPHTFGYHKSKLKKRDVFRSLLPVSVIAEQPKMDASFPSGVTLSFDDHLNIRLEVGFNSDTLRRVIDLLGDR